MSQTSAPRSLPAEKAVRSAVPSHMDEASLDEVFDSDYEYFMRHAHTRQFNRAEAELAMRVAALRPGMSVLDAACGYGRIAVELADRGLRVHGVDRSATLVASAAAETMRRGGAATFEVGDLRRFAAHQRFDAALLWFTSLGYGDDTESRLVLRNLCQSLRPGGCLVIDAVHPVHVHARMAAEDPVLRLWKAGVDVMVDEVSLDDTGGRITSRRTAVRGGRMRECRWSLRLPSLSEYEQWLREAGFTQVRFLGEDGGEAHWTRRRLLILARTPDPRSPDRDVKDGRQASGFTGCAR
jgi:SAM-dependent methyltransferase